MPTLPNPPNALPGEEIDRRRFMQLAAVTSSSLVLLPTILSARTPAPAQGTESAAVPVAPEIQELLKAIDQTDPWLTPSQAHGMTHVKKTQPWTLTADQAKAAGLDRDSWVLEVVDDNNKAVANPRTIAGGNAIRFSELVRLAGQKPVKLFKCLTDPLGSAPLGHGLWEGVAVRDVIALAKPVDGFGTRRVNFIALADDAPKNAGVDSSLAVARIFEDPEGFPPVFLALKYNGDWIPLRNGGPVRLIVPEGYENKNPGFLRKIILTCACLFDEFAAKAGIDTESPVKTCAMHLYSPAADARFPRGKPVAVAGLAQVGPAGLSGAQVAIVPAGTEPGKEDAWLTKLPWQDAIILPPPGNFGAELPGGPAGAFGIDPKDGRPARWPIPFFICRFGTVIRNLAPGKYKAYFRSIDGYGNAQPMPRPFDRSGVVDQIYHPVPFEVA